MPWSAVRCRIQWSITRGKVIEFDAMRVVKGESGDELCNTIGIGDAWDSHDDAEGSDESSEGDGLSEAEEDSDE